MFGVKLGVKVTGEVVIELFIFLFPLFCMLLVYQKPFRKATLELWLSVVRGDTSCPDFALHPMSVWARLADGCGAYWIPRPFPSDDLTDQIALLDDFACVECPVVVEVFFIFHAISVSQVMQKCDKNRSVTYGSSRHILSPRTQSVNIHLQPMPCL